MVSAFLCFGSAETKRRRAKTHIIILDFVQRKFEHRPKNTAYIKGVFIEEVYGETHLALLLNRAKVRPVIQRGALLNDRANPCLSANRL